MLALDEERPEEAARLLKETVRREPENVPAHVLLGVALGRLWDLGAAVDTLDLAHYLRPDDPVILCRYGMALARAGRLAEARRRFQAALVLDPHCEPARRQLEEAGHEAPIRPPAGPGPEPRTAPAASDARVPTAARDAQAAPPSSPLLPVGAEQPTSGARGEDSGPILLPDLPSLEAAERPIPGFSALSRGVVELWAQRMLAWLLLLALPNALVALYGPSLPRLPGAAALAWIAALGVAAAPLLLGMAGEWLYGRPFPPPWRPGPLRLARGVSLSLPYLLLVLGPLCVVGSLRLPIGGDRLFLIALWIMAPLHVLFAPALMMAATDGPGGWKALRSAFALCSRRTWLHLGVMLAVGGLLGGVLALLCWGFAVTLRFHGDAVNRIGQVLAVSVLETVWAALITVCGMDAVSMGGPPNETGTTGEGRRD